MLPQFVFSEQASKQQQLGVKTTENKTNKKQKQKMDSHCFPPLVNKGTSGTVSNLKDTNAAVE